MLTQIKGVTSFWTIYLQGWNCFIHKIYFTTLWKVNMNGDNHIIKEGYFRWGQVKWINYILIIQISLLTFLLLFYFCSSFLLLPKYQESFFAQLQKFYTFLFSCNMLYFIIPTFLYKYELRFSRSYLYWTESNLIGHTLLG